MAKSGKKNPEATTKKKLSPEMITAISAIFIGLCAIGVSMYETSLVRQSQKGAVWPALGGGYSYNQDGFIYLLENAGVGPAIIEYIIITVDDEPVETWEQYFKKLNINVRSYLTSQASGRIIAPQSRIDILEVPAQENIDQLADQQTRIDVEICYCSVFNDCWIITMATRATEVPQCKPDGRLVFLQ